MEAIPFIFLRVVLWIHSLVSKRLMGEGLTAKSRMIRIIDMTHWTETQQSRLSDLMNDPSVTISYWCSDQHGMPANGGSSEAVHPGLIQEVSGPLQICTEKALHATTFPHKWKGSRVWIVALFGEVQKENDKFGSLKREIIGDILPNECLEDSVGARIGRKDLSGADLYEANLRGANLNGANLNGANLRGANLYRADLSGASLNEANLYGANLSGANLYGADLNGADLSGADLIGANLYRVNLSGANLSGANLRGANLSGADLIGAYLGSDIRPEWLPKEYSTNTFGYIFMSV